LAGLLFVFCVTYPFGVAAEGALPADMVPDQYIVVFHDNTPNLRAAARDVARRHGLGLLHVCEHALPGFSARIPRAAFSAVARDSRVQFSEARVVVTLEQTRPTGITRINAGNETNTGDILLWRKVGHD